MGNLQTRYPCVLSSFIALGSAPGRKRLQCPYVSLRLQTHFQCRRALTSPCAPWHWARHTTGKGSVVDTCPTTSDPPPGVGGLWRRHVPPDSPPGREGLRCRNVSRSSRPTSRCARALVLPCVIGLAARQGRALVSPYVLRLQTRLPVREGSGVAMCLVPPGPSPNREGHRRHHMSYGSRLTSRCGRGLASPRASWLSAFEASPRVPKVPDIRLIMASLGTRSRQHIKCIRDKPYTTYD
jgi:hypothetical protein